MNAPLAEEEIFKPIPKLPRLVNQAGWGKMHQAK